MQSFHPTGVQDRGDPRHLRALFERASLLSRQHGLPSVFVGVAGVEGDLLVRDFLDFVEAELRVEDVVFRLLRERAVLWLAQSLPRGTEEGEARRLETLRHAVDVAPWSAMAANNLAWNLLQHGNREAALPLAERAAQLSPGDPMILDTLAGALEAAGRCPEALRTAERALEFLPEHAPEGALAPWLERADRLRAACGKGTAGATSASR